MRLLENDKDEDAGALVRAGVAQVLVIEQIAWMTVCDHHRVPRVCQCASVPACQCASVPGACQVPVCRGCASVPVCRGRAGLHLIGGLS